MPVQFREDQLASYGGRQFISVGTASGSCSGRNKPLPEGPAFEPDVTVQGGGDGDAVPPVAQLRRGVARGLVRPLVTLDSGRYRSDLRAPLVSGDTALLPDRREPRMSAAVPRRCGLAHDGRARGGGGDGDRRRGSGPFSAVPLAPDRHAPPPIRRPAPRGRSLRPSSPRCQDGRPGLTRGRDQLGSSGEGALSRSIQGQRGGGLDEGAARACLERQDVVGGETRGNRARGRRRSGNPRPPRRKRLARTQPGGIRPTPQRGQVGREPKGASAADRNRGRGRALDRISRR